MTKPILYSYWRSSCSWRVRIALNLKKIDYEYRPVHLVRDGGEQHKDNYRALNPMGQVPTFVDGERQITQSLVILEYLERHYPHPALYPQDEDLAWQVREIAEMVNTGIQPLQNLGTLQQLASRFGADAQAKSDWAAHFIAKGFAALETRLAKIAGTYSFGDQVTMADVLLVPQIYGANRFGVNMQPYPTINHVVANCEALDAFVQAAPAAQPDAQ